MTEYSYDCLLRRYAKMTLGMASETIAGSMISPRQLPAGGIKGMKLAMGSVGTGHLQTMSIGSLQVKTAAIGSAHIQNAAIDTAHIKDASIETAKIKDAQITHAKIATATIRRPISLTPRSQCELAPRPSNCKYPGRRDYSAKIGSAAIQTAHITDAAITNAKIGLAAIDTANIVDAAITSAKIGLAQIKNANIEDAAITNAKIGTAAITSAKIGFGEITNALIADAAITSAKSDGSHPDRASTMLRLLMPRSLWQPLIREHHGRGHHNGEDWPGCHSVCQHRARCHCQRTHSGRRGHQCQDQRRGHHQC